MQYVEDFVAVEVGLTLVVFQVERHLTMESANVVEFQLNLS